MRAAVLAVGTELLSTDRLDTNSLAVAALLEQHDVELVEKGIVGDDEAAISGAVAELSREVDLVVVTGGLGPTADDVTREAVAHAAGRPLRCDAAILSALERRFASFGRRMAETNRKQADVIEGAVVLSNPRGTAPAQRLEIARATVFLFPGVPFELEGLLSRELAPWLGERSGGGARETWTLKVAMRPESEIDEALAPAYAEFGRAPISILASPGEVRVRTTAGGPGEERRRALVTMRERIRGLLGDAVFADEEKATLEGVVGARLAERGETVATAESCTGGLVAERLTRIPGSSAWVLGGVVAYANEAKRELLGVAADEIETHGAVSEAVARAMSAGVRRRFGASWAIAVTGIAGPDGGSPEKPVGTVHVAIAGPDGDSSHVHLRLIGDRERIRWTAAQGALDLLRRRLLGLAIEGIGFRGSSTKDSG